MNLSSVLESAQAGSADALNALFEAVRPLVANQGQWLVPSKLAGKFSDSDLVQESLAAAHVAFPEFQGTTPEQFIAWLKVILKNQARYVEKFNTEKRAVGRERPLADHGQDDDTPAGNAVMHEMVQTMESALASLPDDDRRMIEMRLQDRLEFADIAGRTNRTEAAVRKHYARAMQRWKDRIDSDSASR